MDVQQQVNGYQSALMIELSAGNQGGPDAAKALSNFVPTEQPPATTSLEGRQIEVFNPHPGAGAPDYHITWKTCATIALVIFAAVGLAASAIYFLPAIGGAIALLTRAIFSIALADKWERSEQELAYSQQIDGDDNAKIYWRHQAATGDQYGKAAQLEEWRDHQSRTLEFFKLGRYDEIVQYSDYTNGTRAGSIKYQITGPAKTQAEDALKKELAAINRDQPDRQLTLLIQGEIREHEKALARMS